MTFTRRPTGHPRDPQPPARCARRRHLGRRAAVAGRTLPEVTLFRTGERREEDRNTKWMLVGSVTAGIGLRARAIVGLSRSFHRDIQVAQDQLVVRAGPYAAVRHLAYAGNLLMLAGLGVADGAS